MARKSESEGRTVRPVHHASPLCGHCAGQRAMNEKAQPKRRARQRLPIASDKRAERFLEPFDGHGDSERQACIEGHELRHWLTKNDHTRILCVIA